MKTTIRKIGLSILGSFLIIILLALLYIRFMLPNVGDAEEITVEISKDRIIRGEYLANHVAVCIDCHSGRDWSSFSGPIIAGTEGQGGEVFDQSMGFPGRFIARNITPYNLGNWTDGELIRAITTGVNKDGKALFSIMPHPNYGRMELEDIKDIVAYIRTLQPIESEIEDSRPDFPMNFILNTIPKKATFSKRPPKEDRVKYGKYLVTAASCYDCHTKQVKGQFVGEPFAGGFEFLFPDGSLLQSANITPHPSGIGSWTKEDFVSRFRMYADSSYVPHKVNPGEFQTPMPWTFYAQMTEDDLSAIYDYLQTLKPVDQVVTLFTPKDPLTVK
ncbi:cytochrome c [Antarcticibacterium flavum]|uniref:Cytochrome c n=1 Tax=Antarcticibacterium flavum TaxID=2058175 RepID=A0A5B7X6W8_9FLAO|nr:MULTISPECIES: c-type cytochrome [Antarcticibacterium]MCM4159947.1 cytochrome C [Antarcticibacterium sp. W02-3]QCY70458.1 cytochrome c [Antarcticibacterium flavum]